jgi:dipeptidyl aminopeptidase/acylaminoacyl peptidase
MKNKVIGCLLLLLTIASACKKEETVESLPAEKIADLAYGTSLRNTMDVYLPQGRSARTKVVVLVHGGFWTGGDKADLAVYAQKLAEMGYAVANINYRLASGSAKVGLDEQLNDIEIALKFVQSKASEWEISPKGAALAGASAGAHLSMLYTYAYNADNYIKTVISLAGPANLTDSRNVNPMVQAVVYGLIGKDLELNSQAYLSASPLYQVKPGSKPTLIFHGKQDVVVPVQQSVDLKSKFDQYLIKSKLVLYDTGHEVIQPANQEAFFLEVKSWLDTTL